MRPEPKAPRLGDNDSDVISWVESQAQWIRTEFGQRAQVHARLDGGDPMELENLYALRNDGIILVTRSGGQELHLSTQPSRVTLELRHAADGELCTGVGVIGVSKTPSVLIQRAAEAPPAGDHHHF